MAIQMPETIGRLNFLRSGECSSIRCEVSDQGTPDGLFITLREDIAVNCPEEIGPGSVTITVKELTDIIALVLNRYDPDAEITVRGSILIKLNNKVNDHGF